MSPPSLSPGPGVGRKETSSADSLRLHEKASSAIRGGPATYSPQADAASHSLASESSLVSRHAVAAAGDKRDDHGMAHKSFSDNEARSIGEQIGIDWSSAPFDVDQFRRGMDVELEHGLHDFLTNVTDDDPLVTGKIALAHLNEFPDYYTRLERMEEEAKREHGGA